MKALWHLAKGVISVAEPSMSMIWTIVMVILGIIVLVILLRVLFGLI